MVGGKGVEGGAGKDEQVGIPLGVSVCRARLAVEKRHFSEEVTPIEGRQVVVALFAFERLHDADGTPSNQVQLIAGVAEGEESLPGLDGSGLHAGFQLCQGLIPAVLENVDVAQIEKGFLQPVHVVVLEDAVFHPLQRFVELAEHAAVVPGFHQADLSEVVFHVAPAGQERKVAENQAAATFLQSILDLFENVHGGDVHGLDASHIQDDVAARLQLGLDRAIQLIGCAEEQAALELENGGALPVFLKNLHFVDKPHLF